MSNSKTLKKYQIALDDDLVIEVKKRALDEGVPFYKAVETVLRAFVNSNVPLSKVRRVVNGGDHDKK